ncbi:MAG: restriction endonuclease [Chloroflexi bacterium]|nr:restriction endonuclease [Chloroflexota bacterium]
MKIVGEYSFNHGKEMIETEYASELREVKQVVGLIYAADYKTKVGREKTKSGRMLYSPVELNRAFTRLFFERGWAKHKVASDYSDMYYIADYKPEKVGKGAYREMDFVKNHLGIEVQFGKYSFMVYNVAAKMTIFHNLGFIDAGIEIVPVKEFAREMSTGVSYFEQFTWDLEKRGVSDIDIPVLILDIAK